MRSNPFYCELVPCSTREESNRILGHNLGSALSSQIGLATQLQEMYCWKLDRFAQVTLSSTVWSIRRRSRRWFQSWQRMSLKLWMTARLRSKSSSKSKSLNGLNSSLNWPSWATLSLLTKKSSRKKRKKNTTKNWGHVLETKTSKFGTNQSKLHALTTDGSTRTMKTSSLSPHCWVERCQQVSTLPHSLISNSTSSGPQLNAKSSGGSSFRACASCSSQFWTLITLSQWTTLRTWISKLAVESTIKF